MSQNNTRPLDILIYRFTGKHTFFTIPSSWCEECDLTINLVRRTVREMGIEDRVHIRVRPWLENAIDSVFRGGWHAPVVYINGRLFTQGIVPPRKQLEARLTRELSRAQPVLHPAPTPDEVARA